MMFALPISVCSVLLRIATAVEPPEGERPRESLRELVPGVLVGEGIVEFGGTVCADVSHPETPVVYLELLVTGPDSREHESLVLTRVTPSAIHAGLLAAGFEPGHPVRWEGDRAVASASGDRLRVRVRTSGGTGASTEAEFVDLASWAVRQKTGERLDGAPGWGLVFAGSLLDEMAGAYAADKSGTVIGLTGFGTEVIAAAWNLSPQADVDVPVWIVDKDRVPAFGTPVRIRITRDAETADARDTGTTKPASEPRESAAAAEDPS